MKEKINIMHSKTIWKLIVLTTLFYFVHKFIYLSFIVIWLRIFKNGNKFMIVKQIDIYSITGPETGPTQMLCSPSPLQVIHERKQKTVIHQPPVFIPTIKPHLPLKTLVVQQPPICILQILQFSLSVKSSWQIKNRRWLSTSRLLLFLNYSNSPSLYKLVEGRRTDTVCPTAAWFHPPTTPILPLHQK